MYSYWFPVQLKNETYGQKRLLKTLSFHYGHFYTYRNSLYYTFYCNDPLSFLYKKGEPHFKQISFVLFFSVGFEFFGSTPAFGGIFLYSPVFGLMGRTHGFFIWPSCIFLFKKCFWKRQTCTKRSYPFWALYFLVDIDDIFIPH